MPLTSQGEVAAENLGPHDFKTKDGQTHPRIVTAVNGMPCITLTDSDGIDFYQPLKLVQVKKTARKKRPQLSTRRAIPDKDLVPEYLVGAEVRIRHTRTKKERDTSDSRSKALRIFAEADEQFAEIAPRRNDSESTNSDKSSIITPTGASNPQSHEYAKGRQRPSQTHPTNEGIRTHRVSQTTHQKDTRPIKQTHLNNISFNTSANTATLLSHCWNATVGNTAHTLTNPSANTCASACGRGQPAASHNPHSRRDNPDCGENSRRTATGFRWAHGRDIH